MIDEKITFAHNSTYSVCEISAHEYLYVYLLEFNEQLD